jgi:hypothetical protein
MPDGVASHRPLGGLSSSAPFPSSAHTWIRGFSFMSPISGYKGRYDNNLDSSSHRHWVFRFDNKPITAG